MRSMLSLALLALAAGCAGGDDVDPADRADDAPPAAETGAVGEDPGLPTETTDFRATSWSEQSASGIGGRLWVSTAETVAEDGFSLIAQVEGLPEGSYSWGLHRGACSAPDDLVFGLGYGSIADAEGRGEDVANGGGPLGEMPRVFRPLGDGSAENSVFVPLGDDLTRAALAGAEHSIRLHPNVEGDDPGRSTACAPLPPLPG